MSFSLSIQVAAKMKFLSILLYSVVEIIHRSIHSNGRQTSMRGTVSSLPIFFICWCGITIRTTEPRILDCGNAGRKDPQKVGLGGIIPMPQLYSEEVTFPINWEESPWSTIVSWVLLGLSNTASRDAWEVCVTTNFNAQDIRSQRGFIC